jgi:hypothetical protein
MTRKMARLELIGFALGLILFTAGLAMAWLPAGPIGAGIVLMAVSLFDGDGRRNG